MVAHPHKSSHGSTHAEKGTKKQAKRAALVLKRKPKKGAKGSTTA